MDLDLADSPDDVPVRLGATKPLIPMSKLMVLPGQVWRDKTELVRNAQNTPDENARKIVDDTAAIFGWTAKGQEENFVSITFRLCTCCADYASRDGHLD